MAGIGAFEVLILLGIVGGVGLALFLIVRAAMLSADRKKGQQ